MPVHPLRATTVRLGRALLWSAVAVTPVQAAVPPDCRAGPPRVDTLQGVGPRGELILESGDSAVLSGLRWPDAADVAVGAEASLMRHRGRRLTLVRRGEPDRWGRARVDAALEDDAIDLAGSLVEAGLAQVHPGEAEALCRPALLGIEAGARAAGRGIWRTPVRDARDGASLGTEIGRFVVAEGRIVNVGERPSRTYVDFVGRGASGLTVTVSKRTWRLLSERGLSAAVLRGRRVRVRGVVEMWRGPTLDIVSADMIEVLDEERAPRR